MPALPSVDDQTNYITQAAIARGIDPNIALRVARSEGLQPGTWQSNVYKSGVREPSYGPFQLNNAGGLGTLFQKQTGLDPSNWKAGVDFALDQAKAGGWSPWYGAKNAGITGMTGIQGQTQMASNTMPAADAGTNPFGAIPNAFDKSMIGPALLQLGAGIASGSQQGWGPGIGAGLSGINDLLQQRMRLMQEAQRINLDRYNVSTLPSGNQLVFDRATGKSQVIAPNGTAGGGQPSLLNSPVGAQVAAGTSLDELKRSESSFNAANNSNLEMDQLDAALNLLPKSGPLVPGYGMAERIAGAKAANTAAAALGRQLPFDPNQIAAAEQATKITTRLGYDQAKALGSRESNMVIQQAVGIQPGQELTVAGRRRIVAGIRAANQREIDYHSFLTDWVQNHGGDVTGASDAFNKSHPPKEYSDQAIKSALTPTDASGNATPNKTSTGVMWSVVQ
jgi:hypothetical protein